MGCITMTEKDNLMYLIEEAEELFPSQVEAIADHLIANGVTVQRWVPVTERLPEEDVRVLVWLSKQDFLYTRIDTDRLINGKWTRWNWRVTHWMPLPEPPKEVKG